MIFNTSYLSPTQAQKGSSKNTQAEKNCYRKLLGNISGNFLRKIFAKAFIYEGFKEMNIEEAKSKGRKIENFFYINSWGCFLLFFADALAHTVHNSTPDIYAHILNEYFEKGVEIKRRRRRRSRN